MLVVKCLSFVNHPLWFTFTLHCYFYFCMGINFWLVINSLLILKFGHFLTVSYDLHLIAMSIFAWELSFGLLLTVCLFWSFGHFLTVPYDLHLIALSIFAWELISGLLLTVCLFWSACHLLTISIGLLLHLGNCYFYFCVGIYLWFFINCMLILKCLSFVNNPNPHWFTFTLNCYFYFCVGINF